MVNIIDRVNATVALSPVGRYFRLEGSGHPKERIGSRFVTELRAGLTTWAAMAYIVCCIQLALCRIPLLTPL